MLRTLSGRSHEVVTGVCLARGAASRSGVETTVVAFAAMSAAEIAWYVATGEPLDKAGAYAVQGIGAMFIDSVHGSYTNVVGLPLALLYQMLKRAGIDPLGASGRS